MFNLNLNNLTEEDKERIRSYVITNFEKEKKARRVVLFVLSIALPVFLAGMGLVIGGSTGEIILAWLMPMLGLFLAIMFHGISLMLETKSGQRQLRAELVKKAQMELFVKRLTDQGLADELFSEEEAEKPKRQLALSDDGEIVSAEEILEAERRAKQKGAG